MRLGKLKALAVLLKVPVEQLLVTSGIGETGQEFRLDVLARSLALDCWLAGGGQGEPPFWLTDLLRAVLNRDVWAGVFLEGGAPLVRLEPERGGKPIQKSIARSDAKRRRFTDIMALAIRELLPDEQDQKEGIRVNSRRSGAVLGSFRRSGLGRLVRISGSGTAQTRRIAASAAENILAASNN